LGVGTGAFFACQQELAPGAQSGANGAKRKAPDAQYNDGNYDFYFKNGAHAGGDCDGYNSEPGGKTTIYEWYQSEINKQEKRLKAAGVSKVGGVPRVQTQALLGALRYRPDERRRA
jgi:hypothetical protein